MDPKIREYIDANHDRYTPEAIRANLIAAGHDPAAIDEEFAAIAAEREARSGPGDGLLVEAWILFIVGGVTGLAGFAMASSLGSGGSFPIFVVAYLVIGLGIILLLRWAVPRLRITGIWAGVVGLALVPIFGVLMFETCAAAFALGRV
jgi:hypothetical protein